MGCSSCTKTRIASNGSYNSNNKGGLVLVGALFVGLLGFLFSRKK